MSTVTLTILLVIFYFSTIVLFWYIEKRKWNNGICKKNGLVWEYYDTDSQGGRGYIAGEERVWISYPFIDK
jgi:hypothetical protein